MRGGHGCGDQGFTLIELLIVLAILAISLAVAAPAFVTRSVDASSGLLDSLRAARTEAIRSGAARSWERGRQRVVFLPDGSSSGGTVVVGGRRVTVDPLTGAARVVR